MDDTHDEVLKKWIDAYVGEPVGEAIELFKRPINNRLFTRDELADLLNEFEVELDEVVERLKTEEFSMIFYDLTLKRADNDRWIGGILEGGSDLTVGEREKRHSIFLLKDDKYGGYKSVFRKAVEEHDYSIPINSEMCLTAFRDKITKTVKARNPYSG